MIAHLNFPYNVLSIYSHFELYRYATVTLETIDKMIRGKKLSSKEVRTSLVLKKQILSISHVVVSAKES